MKFYYIYIYININVYVCVNFRLCSLVGYQKSLNWQRKEANMVEHIARILEKGTPAANALYRPSVMQYIQTTTIPTSYYITLNKYIYFMKKYMHLYTNKQQHLYYILTFSVLSNYEKENIKKSFIESNSRNKHSQNRIFNSISLLNLVKFSNFFIKIFNFSINIYLFLYDFYFNLTLVCHFFLKFLISFFLFR